jgi:hypothetical protein
MAWNFITPTGRGRVCVHRREEGPPTIHRVRMVYSVDGKPGAMNMTVEDSARLSVELEGVDAAPRTIAIPPQSAVELIGRQLSDRERDPAFRESMAVAQVMAQSVLH